MSKHMPSSHPAASQLCHIKSWEAHCCVSRVETKPIVYRYSNEHARGRQCARALLAVLDQCQTGTGTQSKSLCPSPATNKDNPTHPHALQHTGCALRQWLWWVCVKYVTQLTTQQLLAGAQGSNASPQRLPGTGTGVQAVRAGACVSCLCALISSVASMSQDAVAIIQEGTLQPRAVSPARPAPPCSQPHLCSDRMIHTSS